MAASARSLRYRDVAEALRSTFRTGLGLSSRSHRVLAAEEASEGGDEEEEDPEVSALLADHGHAGTGPDDQQEIEEQDLLNAPVAWKEQRRAHGAAKLGRGFQKPDLQKYRPRVRCHNCKELGHFQKDCKKPRRPRAVPSSSSSSGNGPPPAHDDAKGAFFCGFTAGGELLSFDELVRNIPKKDFQ